MEFKREKYLNRLISCINNRLIKIIIGIKGAGKSYLLNNIFYKYLIETGINDDHIIRFAFDIDNVIDKLDNFLPELPTRVKDETGNLKINSKKFRKYISSLIKNTNETYYIFLDEIQLLENFVGTLNGFLNNENLEIYVTGSNSKFLSNDIATEFRGRGHLILLQPISFAEYYEFSKGDKKIDLMNYLKYGGLPISILTNDEIERQNYLISLYKTIYLKDLKERNNIRKMEEFNQVLYVISSIIGSATNPTKLVNTFNSKIKSNISPLTIRKYLTYLEDAFLISKAMKYDVKGRKYIGSLEKYYFTDLGIRNAILSFRQTEQTHLMENLIYNELISRGYIVDVGVVSKNIRATNGNGAKEYFEVDFVANKGNKKYYIQSAYSIVDEEKLNQEEKSLDNINNNFTKVIITFDELVSYHQNQKGYIIMNIFEFLLNDKYIN